MSALSHRIRRLTGRDYGSLARDTMLYFPLPEAVGDALAANGREVNASTSGVGIFTDDDGKVYLTVAKYNVRDAGGLFNR